jgi:hypothetical protein
MLHRKMLKLSEQIDIGQHIKSSARLELIPSHTYMDTSKTLSKITTTIFLKIHTPIPKKFSQKHSAQPVAVFGRKGGKLRFFFKNRLREKRKITKNAVFSIFDFRIFYFFTYSYQLWHFQCGSTDTLYIYTTHFHDEMTSLVWIICYTKKL